MEILKNKIVDVSTPKKTKKALKVLQIFRPLIGSTCCRYLKPGKQSNINYISFLISDQWDFITFSTKRDEHDIIQPSELKKILAKELLKSGDVVIIEGHKPKRTRWIVSIDKVEYYGDAGLKFSTHYATSLNNPSYRSGSAFCGKFIRFATNEEAAKLVEEVAINTHTETIENHVSDPTESQLKFKQAELRRDMGLDFEGWANYYFAKKGPNVDTLVARDEAKAEFDFKHRKGWATQRFSKALRAFCELNNYELNPKELLNDRGRIICLVDERRMTRGGVWMKSGHKIKKEMIYINTGTADSLKKPEWLKDQQFDFSIWRKTCFIPFQTFYPLNTIYPPLPPFIDVLKKDVQQKRVKLEKELKESELSNLAVYQLGLDLVDTIKFHLSFKNISK